MTWPSTNETQNKVLDHNVNTKMCPNNVVCPVEFIFDVGDAYAFDVGSISCWQWWTANDSATYSGRNPKSFKLQFSIDGTNYVTVDEAENYSAPA